MAFLQSKFFTISINSSHHMTTNLTGSNGRGLIRDGYPREVVRIDGEAEELADLDDTKLKPLKFERLFEWAMVTSAIPTPDRSRTMQCVLKPTPQLLASTNSLQRVAIRVYGFLGKHNLTPTGNWNRCAYHHILFITITLDPDCHPQLSIHLH